MSGLKSSPKNMLQDNSEIDDESEFIYFWDDIEEEDYIIEERLSFRESIKNNIYLVLNLLIALFTIPLFVIITSVASDIHIIIALVFVILIFGFSLISYFYVTKTYKKQFSILRENINMIEKNNLHGSNELLYSKSQFPVLDSFNEFRRSMIDIIRKNKRYSRQLEGEIDLVQSKLRSIHSRMDRISIDVDQSIGNTSVFQNTQNYVYQISNGIDNFTVNFDNALDGIDDISSIIKSIGKQTTMLALNAGIEAAKAGERGKGFEVVASNLRRLAQHAVDSSNRISTMSKNINQNAKSALEDIADGMYNLRNNLNENHELLSRINTELHNSIVDFGDNVSNFDKLYELTRRGKEDLGRFDY